MTSIAVGVVSTADARSALSSSRARKIELDNDVHRDYWQQSFLGFFRGVARSSGRSQEMSRPVRALTTNIEA